MLLDFVRQDTFDGVATEGFRDLFNSFSDIVVLASGSQVSEGGLEGVISSKDDFSLSSFSSGALVLSDNNSVGGLSDESINVATKVNLGNITFLKDSIFRFFGSQGREMSADVVDRDTGGESNTLLHLLLVVNFLDFVFEVFVSEFTDFDDLGTSNSLGNNLFKGSIDDLAGLLIFVEDTGGGQGFFGTFFVLFHFIGVLVRVSL
mmetsp:Transcript_13827/g.11790  ORF Transcript_13827/g.11790 Transcript_13827/m.11790 type:complete len:205 (-) Transcript_13827:27-641(-)